MNKQSTMLAIEYEASVRSNIQAFFVNSGFEVLVAGEGQSGLSLFRDKRPDIVLVSLRLPVMSGLEVIDTIVAEAPETPVVALSDSGAISEAMDVIRRGAWDFVAKPITDMSELEHVVRSVLKRARLQEENRRHLEHLEQEFRSTVENVSDWVWSMDLDGKYGYSNAVVETMLGYTEKEIIGKSIWDFLHPEDIGNLKSLVRDMALDKKGWQGKLLRKRHNDGTDRYIESNASTIFNKKGDVTGFLGADRDITERKFSEEKLKQHSQHMELLYHTAMGFVEMSLDEDIYGFLGEKLHQLAPNAIVIINSYNKASNIICTRSVKGLGNIAPRIMALMGKNPVGMEFLMDDETGKRELLKGRLVDGPGGLHELSFGAIPAVLCKILEPLIGMHGILVIGITRKNELLGNAIFVLRKPAARAALLKEREFIETLVSQAAIALQRREAESALVESEEKYRELVENMNDAVYVIDAAGKITYISPVMEGITGYTCSEILGRNYQTFFPAEEASKLEISFQELSKRDITVREYILNKRSGESIWVRTSSRLIWKNGEYKGFHGVLMDITESKMAAQELAKKANELTVLNQLGKEIGADLSVDSAVETATQHIFQAIDSDFSMLFLKEGDNLLLKGFSSGQNPFPENNLPVHRVGKCLCGIAVESGHPVYSTDIHNDPRCTLEECKEAGFSSIAVMPLISGGDILGVLGVASLKERDYKEQSAFIEALAGEIAMGLKNAILYEKAQSDTMELKERLLQIQASEKEKKRVIPAASADAEDGSHRYPCRRYCP
jgi:PAS domain S-box-containing protein